jgi:predicted permease
MADSPSTDSVSFDGFECDGIFRTLALISQQVTIPLFFFTKFIHCNQDWSTDPCPDVTQWIKDVWVLLIWPLYVVGMGLGVGYVIVKLSGTPNHQLCAVLVACGFGNSTGLPITLLTVVHANFPSTADLGRVDPCLFLSVYLLLYPVLQWGIGGWLLAPPTTEKTNHTSQILRIIPLKYYTLYGISVFGIRTADLSYSVYIMFCGL